MQLQGIEQRSTASNPNRLPPAVTALILIALSVSACGVQANNQIENALPPPFNPQQIYENNAREACQEVLRELTHEEVPNVQRDTALKICQDTIYEYEQRFRHWPGDSVPKYAEYSEATAAAADVSKKWRAQGIIPDDFAQSKTFLFLYDSIRGRIDTLRAMESSLQMNETPVPTPHSSLKNNQKIFISRVKPHLPAFFQRG